MCAAATFACQRVQLITLPSPPPPPPPPPPSQPHSGAASGRPLSVPLGALTGKGLTLTGFNLDAYLRGLTKAQRDAEVAKSVADVAG